MVFDDQDVLDDQFLLDTHLYLHGHIVDVYQIQWLSTEDGLHGGICGLASNIQHFSQLQMLNIILWAIPSHQNLSLRRLSVRSLP